MMGILTREMVVVMFVQPKLSYVEMELEKQKRVVMMEILTMEMVVVMFVL